MSGPFPAFWTVGCFLVPLAATELKLRARDGGGPLARLTVSALLVSLTLAMLLGAFAFGMFSLRIATGAPLSLG